MTQAMTTEAQAGARRAPACAESLFSLWCKGGKRRQGYQAKATISVQQDQDQQNGRMEVIVEPRKVSSSESLANCSRPSRSIFGKRTRALLYK